MSNSLTNEAAEELLSLVEDSLLQAKKAYAELRVLQESKVELEKGASTHVPKFDPGMVNKTVRMLITHNFLHEDQQEKFASSLTERPENALKLVQRLLEISAPAHIEGRGVPKAASTKSAPSSTEDDSAWTKVIKEGA